MQFTEFDEESQTEKLWDGKEHQLKITVNVSGEREEAGAMREHVAFWYL